MVSALSDELAGVLRPYCEYTAQIKNAHRSDERYTIEKTYEQYECDVRNMAILNEIYEAIDDSDYWSKKRFNA